MFRCKTRQCDAPSGGPSILSTGSVVFKGGGKLPSGCASDGNFHVITPAVAQASVEESTRAEARVTAIR